MLRPCRGGGISLHSCEGRMKNGAETVFRAVGKFIAWASGGGFLLRLPGFRLGGGVGLAFAEVRAEREIAEDRAGLLLQLLLHVEESGRTLLEVTGHEALDGRALH